MKIPISFKKNERHIYDFIRSKRNYSDYIKELVEADMNKNKSIKRNYEEPMQENNNNLMEIEV